MPCVESITIKVRWQEQKIYLHCYDSSSKVINYTIQTIVRLLLVKMSSWMKKNHKDWSAQEGDYDTSLYEEKEQTRGSLQEIATPLSSPPPLT